MSEELAKRFHEAYERLAPSFGYETRRASAVQWDDVPEQNKRLMIAVCEELFPPDPDRVELLGDVVAELKNQLSFCIATRSKWERERVTHLQRLIAGLKAMQ